MEKIPTSGLSLSDSGMETIPIERTKLHKLVVGNARILVMAFILFAVVVVMTTDIRFITISSLRDLGLEFFVLLFGSYGMYICCTDGGTQRGYSTDVYSTAVERFQNYKDKIEENYLDRMDEYCQYYCDEELKKARMQYLSLVCITYDVYLEKYAMLGKVEIDKLDNLTSSQKKAIKKANKVRRIKLTPERIMTQGKAVHTRSPLAATPDAIKNMVMSAKILKMSFTTLCMALIACEILIEPSWAVFAEVCLKIAGIIINGAGGSKDGYNYIAVHTVNYMNAQSTLMQRAIQYADANPTTQTTSEISLVTTKI